MRFTKTKRVDEKTLDSICTIKCDLLFVVDINVESFRYNLITLGERETFHYYSSIINSCLYDMDLDPITKSEYNDLFWNMK